MKNRSTLIISLLLFVGCQILGVSCKSKKFDDALPVLTLDSVKRVSADSVALFANISNEGIDKVQYYGFSYSQYWAGNDLPNQTLFQENKSGHFKTIVYAKHDSTYFFKAFAANGFGYRISNVIEYTVPHPEPVIIPCTLSENYFTDTGNRFSVYAYDQPNYPYGNKYQVTIIGHNEDIRMNFPNKPINGVYTTAESSSDLKEGQVYISVTQFYIYSVESGAKVYVNVDSDGKISISACALKYGNSTLSGNVSYK